MIVEVKANVIPDNDEGLRNLLRIITPASTVVRVPISLSQEDCS